MARTERIFASATLTELTAATVQFSINSAIANLCSAAQRVDREVLWGTFEILVSREQSEDRTLGGLSFRAEHASVQVSALGLDASQPEDEPEPEEEPEWVFSDHGQVVPGRG